tara:strand:- start:548 stop:754 length:207 start_codon:yes stop_codon:yes gene_type:complete
MTYLKSEKLQIAQTTYLEDLQDSQIKTCKLVIALSLLNEAPTKDILEYLNEKIQDLQNRIDQMEKHLK